jgi:hypothetical protein
LKGLGIRLVFTLAGMLGLRAALDAQDARVVAANSSNGRILEIHFDPPGSTVLNTDAPARVGLQSLVFRDDGAAGVHLFAADHQRGQVVFYSGAVGAGTVVLDAATPTHPAFPDGLSLDAHDNLFGTSSAGGAGAEKDARVWVIRRDAACQSGCLAGGYAAAVGTLDDDVAITIPIGAVPTTLTLELLEETRVVPFDAGALAAGDLLVLASDPAVLLRYPAAAVESFLTQLAEGGTPAQIQPDVLVYPSVASVPLERRFPEDSQPNGMDFTPEGNLLVASGNGTILVFQPDGTRLPGTGGFVDFAGGLGQGKFKLVVGPQDGVFRAFVSDRNGGEVLRFRLEDDGTGTLDGVVADPEFPVGIATTTANVVPTPAGLGVTIQPTNLMRTTIENVVLGGATGVSVVLFEDPRESEVSTPAGQPLHRALHLSEIRADLPPDAEIPAYVRAFRKGDPDLGPPTFLLIVADTSVDVLGLVAHVVDEGLILGYEPDCDDPDPTAQPRLFWTPSPDERPVLESPRFIDVSNACGSSRGLTQQWSLFLASARDTRPTSEIAATKLSALVTVLARAQCIDRRLMKSLQRSLDSAQRQFARGKIAATINELGSFSALIQGAPGAFASCDGNEGGELRARAGSAVFMLQKML